MLGGIDGAAVAATAAESTEGERKDLHAGAADELGKQNHFFFQTPPNLDLNNHFLTFGLNFLLERVMMRR